MLECGTGKVYVAVRSSYLRDYDDERPEEVLSAHVSLEGAKAAVPGRSAKDWKMRAGVWYVKEKWKEWSGKDPDPSLLHHYIAELQVLP